jgi:hypothetical protein
MPQEFCRQHSSNDRSIKLGTLSAKPSDDEQWEDENGESDRTTPDYADAEPLEDDGE